MPLTSINIANYNQELVTCNYCGCKVKRSRLSSHKANKHGDELRAEPSRQREEYQEFDVELLNTTRYVIPERPKCVILPNRDSENWDDSNYPTYNPLLASAKKPVIRGTYYIGRSKKEKQQCRDFENARMTYLRESGQIWNPEVEQYRENLDSSYEDEQLSEISGYSNTNSEETWEESSILSCASLQVTSDQDSYKSCISEDLNMPIQENASPFVSSLEEYLRNLPDEKKASFERKVNEMMREYKK